MVSPIFKSPLSFHVYSKENNNINSVGYIANQNPVVTKGTNKNICKNFKSFIYLILLYKQNIYTIGGKLAFFLGSNYSQLLFILRVSSITLLDFYAISSKSSVNPCWHKWLRYSTIGPLYSWRQEGNLLLYPPLFMIATQVFLFHRQSAAKAICKFNSRFIA